MAYMCSDSENCWTRVTYVDTVRMTVPDCRSIRDSMRNTDRRSSRRWWDWKPPACGDCDFSQDETSLSTIAVTLY